MAQTKVEKKTGTIKKAAPERKAPSQPNRLIRYIRETRGELRKVTWPTREESQRLTLIVIGVTAVMAVFLGFLDFIFSRGVRALVEIVAGF